MVTVSFLKKYLRGDTLNTYKNFGQELRNSPINWENGSGRGHPSPHEASLLDEIIIFKKP